MKTAKKSNKKHQGINHWGWKLAVALLLIGAIAWWLMLPASNAAIAISAQTGSLTLEPLCGERLIWDLPAGRIGPRSSLPGANPVRTGNVTLILTSGARVRLESTGPGIFRLAVERAPVARSCGADSVQPFQAIFDGMPLADDPVGFSYAAGAPETGQGSHALSLPLSGRIVLGEAVQQGAGWATGSTASLQSGAVTRRVVPAFSHERVTLSTERLDEGSLLDTHACLEGPANVATGCPSGEAAPAVGFLRTISSGGLSVQIYARGPVGVQAFSGASQQLFTIPNSMAAWQSEPLRIWAVFIGLLIGFWKHVIEFFEYLSGFRVLKFRRAPIPGSVTSARRGRRLGHLPTGGENWYWKHVKGFFDYLRSMKRLEAPQVTQKKNSIDPLPFEVEHDRQLEKSKGHPA